MTNFFETDFVKKVKIHVKSQYFNLSDESWNVVTFYH